MPPQPAPALAADAGTVAPNESPIERRRSPRHAELNIATLQPSSGDASCDRQVMVCNLSLGGVGFRSAQRFAPGETYRITLGSGPLFLNARLCIVSCRNRQDGMYDVGAEFC